MNSETHFNAIRNGVAMIPFETLGVAGNGLDGLHVTHGS